MSVPTSGLVTITNPNHQFFGEKVTVIRKGNGLDPDLIVRRENGNHFSIVTSFTDLFGPSENSVSEHISLHLLSVEGLKKITQLFDEKDFSKINEPQVCCAVSNKAPDN
jgi:hypothetical protein